MVEPAEPRDMANCASRSGSSVEASHGERLQWRLVAACKACVKDVVVRSEESNIRKPPAAVRTSTGVQLPRLKSPVTAHLCDLVVEAIAVVMVRVWLNGGSRLRA